MPDWNNNLIFHNNNILLYLQYYKITKTWKYKQWKADETLMVKENKMTSQ